MDFFVILVMVIWLQDGNTRWVALPFQDDMQSCMDEAAAIKDEQKLHPEVKDAQGYCIPFSLRKEAKR